MFEFGLNVDQRELQSSVRRYVDSGCPMPVIRRIVESGDLFPARVWQDICELGFVSVAIPEAYGGSAMGCVDVMAIMESLGRVPLPAPYLEAVTVAHLLAASGTETQKARYLPGIGSGDLIATCAIDEPQRFWTADSVRATARRAGKHFRLSGSKLWVPYADVADVIVCAVRTSDLPGGHGITLFAVEAAQAQLTTERLDIMDDAYVLCALNLDDVIVDTEQIIGEVDRGWEAWLAARRMANVLASAEMVGGMGKCLEMIVEYSKERVQFGKPIGSYQAIKHRCADLLIDLEMTRGAVYYAAWALQQGSEDADSAVSSAKACASDAYVKVAEQCLQLFGAIGFTWEHDIHFYLKRARRLQITNGDAAYHRERLAEGWL